MSPHIAHNVHTGSFKQPTHCEQTYAILQQQTLDVPASSAIRACFPTRSPLSQTCTHHTTCTDVLSVALHQLSNLTQQFTFVGAYASLSFACNALPITLQTAHIVFGNTFCFIFGLLNSFFSFHEAQTVFAQSSSPVDCYGLQFFR